MTIKLGGKNVLEVLSERLRTRDRKLSLRAIEEITGVSKSTLSGIESGEKKNPTLRTVTALVEYFGIDEVRL